MSSDRMEALRTREDRYLAELLFRNRLVTLEQVRSAVQRQTEIRRYSGFHIPLGEALFLLGHVSMGEVQLMRTSYPSCPEQAPIEDLPPIGEVLVQIKALTEEELSAALAFQHEMGSRGKHELLGQILIGRGAISAGDLDAALHILHLREEPSSPDGIPDTQPIDLSEAGFWVRTGDATGGTWVRQPPSPGEYMSFVTSGGKGPWWDDTQAIRAAADPGEGSADSGLTAYGGDAAQMPWWEQDS